MDDFVPGPVQPTATANAASEGLVKKLNLAPHPEGGFFRRTDTNPLYVTNPFRDEPREKNASSSILYLLPPNSPSSKFHRNKSRTYFSMLPTGAKRIGKVRYVIIHADEVKRGDYARVETYVAGPEVDKGEKAQWVIEGGKYKAVWLIDDGAEGEGAGALISEVVVPAFDFAVDHDFLSKETLYELVGPKMGKQLEWLILEKKA